MEHMSRNVCSMTVRSRVTSTASSLSDRLVRQPLWQNTRERVDDLDAWLSYPASSFVLIAGEVDEAIPKEALQISLQVEPGVNNNKGTSQDSASVPRREPKKVRAGLLDWWRRYLSSSTECTMVAVIGGKITVKSELCINSLPILSLSQDMYASKLRSSDGFIIFVVGVAVFTDMMLYGLLVPILPYVLSDRVGVPQEDVQKWNSLLLGSFGGALTIGSLVIGWIGDRVRSRQTPFLFGLIAVGLSTLAISLTRSITILLVARILQGFSGAVVSTVGYAILFDVVGSEKIGRAMGFVSMSQSFGLLVGPAVGGVLYEWGGGYFNTFIPAFVLIVLEIVLRGLVVVRGRKGGRSSCIPGGEEEEEEASSKASLLLATEGSHTNICPHTHYGTTTTTHDPDLENNNNNDHAQNPAANNNPTYPDTDTKPSPSSSSSHNPSASTLTTLRLLLSTP
ncbi:MAG: hypothetical protein Q9206_005096, partial [Seirophora lacunosa]